MLYAVAYSAFLLAWLWLHPVKMKADKSLPIIDAVYRLGLELNKAVIKFPRNQRPGLGRKIEDAGFNLLAGLSQARYLKPSCKLTVLTHVNAN